MSELIVEPLKRVVPVTMEIKQYFHCGKCLETVPRGTSPRAWADVSVGLTAYGLQVWCNRHRCNVAHIDFMGQRLPANIATRGK